MAKLDCEFTDMTTVIVVLLASLFKLLYGSRQVNRAYYLGKLSRCQLFRGIGDVPSEILICLLHIVDKMNVLCMECLHHTVIIELQNCFVAPHNNDL